MDLLLNNYMRSEGHGVTWAVTIDPPSRPVKSYYEEACIAAEMWWENKVGKIQLCLSGGLDSEFVLATFLSLGMEVEPVIMRTAYNSHETQYAFKFCEKNKLTPTIIDLDYDKFVSSDEFLDIAYNIECADWRLISNMWLASQLDDTVLTGNDPPHLKLNSLDNLWYLDEEEVIHSQFNYWKKYSIKGTPFFLSYTPEMMYSFLIDPTIEKLANHGFPGKLGTNSSKVHVFNRVSNFNLEQRTKQTGYEFVEKNSIFNHPNIQTVKALESIWKGTSDHQYHDVVRKLSQGVSSKALTSESF